MRIYNFTALVAICAPITAGCDPSIRVSGVVHDDVGKGISGAQVRMHCPNGWNQGSTDTDLSGQFQLRVGPGCLDRKCEVSVSIPAGGEKRYIVGENCYKTHAQCPAECNVVKIDATF